ncbi:hypothetical protein RJ640_011545 [Escallonia rubra]|uniref:RING-type domain-containing protein n=1 Tax=Escallonia rubra TaxID=112253 RepID=A0AA88R5J2_9ASTE|nr:hypothetical protein RJ640_011545 [Escallonia rubra]
MGERQQEEEMMTCANGSIQVPSRKLAALMTCPICNKIFKDPTNISECLHTCQSSIRFDYLVSTSEKVCRKCIRKKITDEKLRSCPVCNIALGGAPLDKLRPDHCMHDLREKIFACVRNVAKESEVVQREGKECENLKGKVKEPEILSIPLPGRQKEKSLSSLVSTSKLSNRTVMTERRKPNARKGPAFNASTLSDEDPIDVAKDHPESSSYPINLCKTTSNKKQNSYAGESSKHKMPKRSTENNGKLLEGMTDLWEPLNCLVDAAGATKSSKSSSEGFISKPAPSAVNEYEVYTPKAQGKEHEYKSKIHGMDNNVKKGPKCAPSVPVKPTKMHSGRRKKAVAPEGFRVPAQAVVGPANCNYEKRVYPIWLSLGWRCTLASDTFLLPDDKTVLTIMYLKLGVAYIIQSKYGLPAGLSSLFTNGSLIPFLSAVSFARDVNIPVSLIRTYLVRKLDLYREDEVEIRLRGQPLLPSLHLHNVVDLWSRTAPTSERIATAVGSPAGDFVMVLSYARKPRPP